MESSRNNSQGSLNYGGVYGALYLNVGNGKKKKFMKTFSSPKLKGSSPSKSSIARLEAVEVTSMDSSTQTSGLIDWGASHLYTSVAEGTACDLEMLQQAAPTLRRGEQSKIYSEIECGYHGNILKKKLSRKDEIDEADLEEVYWTGLQTVGALMNLLMLGKLFAKVIRVYGQREMVSAENCVKVLVRAKKMYDAKDIIVMLLKSIIKLEQLKVKVKKEIDEETIKMKVQIRLLTQKVISGIEHL